MVKLPCIDHAIIADAKLIDYLLNPVHPRGGAKARFLARFGFALDRPGELRKSILAHASANEVLASQPTDFGAIFEVDGALPSPDGRNPIVRTVWMLDTDATAPRLITLVPRLKRTPA